MSRRRQIYEGKAKVLFEGPEPGTLVQHFKDDATAFNNKKKGTITGKGVLNNRISEHLMTKLSAIGIPTHFVRRLNMREQLVKEVEKSNTANKGDDRLWKPEVDKAGNGYAVIRFLPAPNGEDIPFVKLSKFLQYGFACSSQ